MSSDSIPNLNTLRTARRGTRLRGRRTPRAEDHGGEQGEAELARAHDHIIQQTDYDASSSRMSAVSLGYLTDPYAKTFFPTGQEIPRRYPLINRGTYVRTTAIDRLVLRFLETDLERRKQIVSLGAGSDTRFFRLCAGRFNVVYHELDFEANVAPKRAVIRSSQDLSRMSIGEGSGAEGACLKIHALDLRDLTAKSPPALPELEHDLPTLIVSECCLCYLPPDEAASVIQYFSMNLENSLAIVLYEPIRPFDAFGRTMVSNLASRGIALRTLQRYSSLDAQRQRLRLAGFVESQGARDVHQLWRDEDWVSRSEQERIEKAEWLDEVEEWKLLASHYCVAWGWRGDDHFQRAWGAIEGAATVSERQDESVV